MTKEEYDRLVENRYQSYKDSPPFQKQIRSDEFYRSLAVVETELVYGPRETCERPPAKGLMNS